MNDDFGSFPGAETPAAAPREDHTLGASTIFKLCDEVIQPARDATTARTATSSAPWPRPATN